jgi:hypothetical protein
MVCGWDSLFLSCGISPKLWVWDLLFLYCGVGRFFLLVVGVCILLVKGVLDSASRGGNTVVERKKLSIIATSIVDLPK